MIANESKTFLLTGSRSQLGMALLPKLAERQDRVVAVAQTPCAAFSNIEWVTGRLPEAKVPALQYDALISFGPMDKLAEWLAQQPTAPAARVIATSSMSAVSKHSARYAEDRDISRRLVAGEQQLRTICAQLEMPCVIFRPTMIYGLGLDENLSAVARSALKRGVFVAPQARGMRQPVHAEDVADAALRAATKAHALDETIELGGGERLTVREMFRRVHRSLPRKTLWVPAPAGVMALLALVSKRFRGAVSRLESDLIADNSRVSAALDLEPRGFQPNDDTWRNL